ncbi:2-oxoglutarate dehydrogenase complex dihydrolipoyllysine-residue succinyltransferase [Candidatus Chloroploca asiatica]|uniref:Dihydrolipoyllysine-residue succinyltransferase component of 2-oxoglutarate dehydrogenase complex n=1 Tax=Candidatus Chloroploca asiatica TaxID=1506545 RepID=A0A2H3KRY7_9CHLR|nr:2-oxoglutarate dehydrogenase complex dihydrolipoyllysine-residue succinyltransferase [Candidatus Chloroploca asiatica]PDW00368.1 dihydrolipoamide succinyltransferase [Candidatus Chloroploca asiatica]
MAYEIKVPALGESIVEAIVARWLKQAGEAVAAGEPVVELETDKVNLEVAADHAGVIGALLVQEGATVGIGDVLTTIVPGSAVTVVVPPPTATAVRSENGAHTTQEEAVSLPGGVVATPTAQKVAAQHGIDLRTLSGTGPDGRITKEDVLRSVEAPATSAVAVPAVPAAPARPQPVDPPRAAPAAPVRPIPAPAPTPIEYAPTPAPVVAAGGDGRREERQRLTRRRQTIARRLVEAQQTAAMLTTFNEVDMSSVMELRKRHKDGFKERHGVNLGFMSFFTKAAVGALKAFPTVNAEIQGEEVVIKHYYDIGMAVGVEEGLVVPVVRDADRKSFAQIEQEIGLLAGKARNGTLSLAELMGGTFTITNGGVYGSLMSTPILNAPQVGILGLHKIEERPIVRDGQIVIRPMMYLALSYDHRLIDGSTAVRFLVRLKELMEDPEALLLEG